MEQIKLKKSQLSADGCSTAFRRAYPNFRDDVCLTLLGCTSVEPDVFTIRYGDADTDIISYTDVDIYIDDIVAVKKMKKK